MGPSRPAVCPGKTLAWLDWAAVVPTKAAAGMAVWQAASAVVLAALWAPSCSVQRHIHRPETTRDPAGPAPGRRLTPLADSNRLQSPAAAGNAGAPAAAAASAIAAVLAAAAWLTATTSCELASHRPAQQPLCYQLLQWQLPPL